MNKLKNLGLALSPRNNTKKLTLNDLTTTDTTTSQNTSTTPRQDKEKKDLSNSDEELMKEQMKERIPIDPKKKTERKRIKIELSDDEKDTLTNIITTTKQNDNNASEKKV